MAFIFCHHPSCLFKDSSDTELFHLLVSRYRWICSVMQKNARLQPLQALIQIISCFCCHLGEISYQILHWMLWRNCLHLTCKRHSKSNREEIKWNTRAESISRELLNTHEWSWYHFFTMMHFNFAHFQHKLIQCTLLGTYCGCASCFYTFTVVEIYLRKDG